MANINDWLVANKLSLNIKKSNYILFHKSNQNIVTPPSLVVVNNVSLERVDYTKFLGIVIDSGLTWSMHTLAVQNKVAQGTAILFRTRKFLNKCTLLMLYYSLIYPHLMYGVEVWGKCSPLYLNKIIKAQKRAVKALTFSKLRDPSAPIFRNLELLTFSKIYVYFIGTFMFKYYYKKRTDIFFNFLLKTSTCILIIPDKKIIYGLLCLKRKCIALPQFLMESTFGTLFYLQ